MIGHCLGASGGLEAIATVKAITTGWLHPSINQFVRDTFNFCVQSFLFLRVLKKLPQHGISLTSLFKTLHL